MYFDIKRIHNNSYKCDDDDDDEYYDDFDNNQGCVYYDFKIIEEQEHDEMSSIFERITQEKINSMNYNDTYHVKITHVEIELYKNQIKFVNKYRRVDVYIKANEKHNEWRTIFFNDPENFTNNEIVKQDFDEDEIKILKEEIIKLSNVVSYENIIENSKNENNIGYIAGFTNRYIHSKYMKHLKKLEGNVISQQVL